MAKQALELWVKMVTAELVDPDFPGLSYMVGYLTNLKDPDLVWRYADYILRRDPLNGIKVVRY
jgi:vacuolar protein sorting-associated protein 3